MSTIAISTRTTRRRFARLAALFTTLAAISPAFVSVPAHADPASAPPGAASATGWYLALGDSVAAGYQPGLGDDRDGGYVGPVLDAVQKDAPKTNLSNLACSGETSTTMVNGGRCSYEEGSQLAQAVVFLRAHSWTTRLVTVTIGANDVTPCLRLVPDNAAVAACLQASLTTLRDNLGSVLSQVHAAAPGARIVVTNYYNPYLALWFSNPGLAGFTTALQGQLNGVIGAVTSKFGATADVATAFQSGDTTLVSFPGPGGVAPQNVAVVCQLTWMCSRNDIHPNDAGYAVIATAVTRELS